MTTGQIRRQAIAYLSKAQTPAGGFMGHASSHQHDFSQFREHPTIFFTALILACLHEVSGTKVLRRGAARFLLNHKSKQWTWNYWKRGTAAVTTQAYPDDLDDTACALAALSLYKSELVDGGVLGHVARQLIACETAPGGPYQTWLIDHTAFPAWHDVDLAVNANINFFLSLKGTKLKALREYLERAIQSQKLSSAYYLGTAPSLYFIIRGYDGEARTALANAVRRELSSDAGRQNPLTLALLLSSACRLGLSTTELKPVAERLTALAQDDHWPAEALYYEPPIDGIVYFAGSDALTTAFALEALSLYELLPTRSRLVENLPPKRSATATQAALEAQTSWSPLVAGCYKKLVETIVLQPDSNQITNMAGLTATACQAKLKPALLRHLNLASLQGWMAYTIYDDFLDGEGKSALLGVANIAQRRSVRHFHGALPEDSTFQQLVAETFDTIDEANTWEVARARGRVQGQLLRISRLPDYGDYRQLAERSWGHSLAAQAILAALGYDGTSLEQRQLKRFFRAFLIARQLNDDAHDWESDLAAGRLSAVVSRLLRDYNRSVTRLNVPEVMADLRLCFWDETITHVAELITRQLVVARDTLRAASFLKDKREYSGWLRKLEFSTAQVLSERAEAQKFMASYDRP